MSGADRETFLTSVREALGHKSTTPPAQPTPAIDDAVVRLANADEDLPTLFTKCAEEVGMHVQSVSEAKLAAQLVHLTAELGIKSAATSLNDDALNKTLTQSGVELYNWQRTDAQDGLFDVDAGITDVLAALAETGTLICTSTAQQSRGLSLIPQIHIAILRASDILPDMLDFWPRYDGVTSKDLPSSIVLITGPSKTADIEGQLVQGVHGPGEVYILLVT